MCILLMQWERKRAEEDIKKISYLCIKCLYVYSWSFNKLFIFVVVALVVYEVLVKSRKLFISCIYILHARHLSRYLHGQPVVTTRKLSMLIVCVGEVEDQRGGGRKAWNADNLKIKAIQDLLQQTQVDCVSTDGEWIKSEARFCGKRRVAERKKIPRSNTVRRGQWHTVSWVVIPEMFFC